MESPSSDRELLKQEDEVVEDVDSNARRRRFMKFLPSLPTRGRYVLKSSGSEDEGAPKDHFHLVYIGMLMSGVGFLIPWSCYTAAIDYFFYYYLEAFPAVSVLIPVSYLVATVLSASLNMVLVRAVSIHPRITFGHVMFFTSLLMIPLLDIGIYNCTISTTVSFYITLLTVGMVGLGSGIQQSSFYGLATMLPRKYPQAIMAGESIAGFLGSVFRIITKLSFRSERVGSIVFFSLSASFILVCVLWHCYIRKNKMVNFYVRKCRSKKPEEQEGRDVVEMEDFLLQKDLSEAADEASDIAGAMENVSEDQQTEEAREERSDITEQKFSPKRSLRAVKRVVLQIWPLIGAIFTSYFVTLLLFPGLLSEVQNCFLGSWTPVILIAIFNFVDLVAKWLALLHLRWSPKQLLMAAISRVVLIPLVLLCVTPSPTHPVLGGNVVIWAGLFSLVLGGTNGYLGSLSMINVATHVKNNKDRELAGTLMTWVLFVGLFMGAISAYALTPLTTIGDHIHCTNATTFFFDLCVNSSNSQTTLPHNITHHIMSDRAHAPR